MNPLALFMSRHKAYIHAVLVVLALTSVLSLCYGTYQLGKQREELKNLAEANKLWAESWDKMNKLRDLEHKNAVDLQAKLDAITANNHAARQKLKELERDNEEVRDFLDTRLHPDLERLLNDK